MTRNEFIQRWAIKAYGQFENMKRLVEYANEAADKLEACGVPFDDDPKVIEIDADFEETSDNDDAINDIFAWLKLRDETVEILRKNGIRTFKDLIRQRKIDIAKICSNDRDLIHELTNFLHAYGYDWAVD